MPQASSKKTTGVSNTFIYSLPSAVQLAKAFERLKFVTLLKSGKDTKFPKDLRPISFLSTRDKLVKKVILKKCIEEKDPLNASQFGIHPLDSTALERVRLIDYIALNFRSNMSTAAVPLDIEKETCAMVCFISYLD
jgi:hypothetical protein